MDLVKAWEPFAGGRAGLYELHHMDIIDKHRSIIPTMTGAEFSLPVAAIDDFPADQVIVDPTPDRMQVWDGKLLASGTIENSPPVGTQRRCSTRLAFDDEHMRGRDLLETLRRQLEIVEAVLDSFETRTPPTFVDTPAPDPVSVPFNTWVAVRGGDR